MSEENGMHDVVVVGIPLIAILAGILFNRTDSRETRSDVKELRAEVATKHTEVMNRLSQIDADLRQFYHLTGKHDGWLDALERRG